MNRTFCVGNVAQTPQAGYIWITSASLRFGRSSYGKTSASPRSTLIWPAGWAFLLLFFGFTVELYEKTTPKFHPDCVFISLTNLVDVCKP